MSISKYFSRLLGKQEESKLTTNIFLLCYIIDKIKVMRENLKFIIASKIIEWIRICHAIISMR